MLLLYPPCFSWHSLLRYSSPHPLCACFQLLLSFSALRLPSFSPCMGIGKAITLRQGFGKLNLTAQEPHKEGELTNAEFVRNTIIDLLDLALIMGSAVWLGRLTGTYVGQTWGNVLGIVVAMAVGFVVAFLVGKAWGRSPTPRSRESTQSGRSRETQYS